MESLYLIGINRMALQVSSDAKLIDDQLRKKSAEADKRFAHLLKNSEKRKEKAVKVASGQGNAAWSDKLAKMREKYPNAYRPWTKSDDALLKQNFQSGVPIKEMSHTLGRHENSILIRLQKHFGEDVVL